MERVKIGIIGCGNISAAYLRTVKAFPVLDCVALADMFPERAAARAEEFGVGRGCTMEELLADPEYAALVTAYEADEVAARAAEADLDDAIDRDLDGGDDRGHAGEVSR